MQPLRGTPAYWEKTLRDLHTMVRQMGKPTFFVTFSAAEMRLPELIEVMKAQQGEQRDFSGLDRNEKWKILRSNPVTVILKCIHSLQGKRVDTLMTAIILSPAQPIGPVQVYFYRVEFPARGSRHIHMLVRIKDVPAFEDPEAQTNVTKFIGCHITFLMRDEKEDSVLHKIVSEVQVHSRNPSQNLQET